MGLLFSRFRTKPTTKELLEDLQKQIDALEEYKQSTEVQQKVLVRNLVVYSVLLYLIVAGVFFFYSYPATTRDRLIYCVPFLIFPILLYVLKKFLQWYFVQKLRNNEDNLLDLRKRKKSLLDFAMETETYKVVKELLEKYDPAYHRKVFERPAIEGAPLGTPLKGSYGEMELRRRNVSPRGSPPGSSPNTSPSMTLNNSPGSPNIFQHYGKPFTNPPYPTPQFLPRGGQRFVRPPMQPMPMPRPVLPRERTLVDRLLDYLVGDGPSNRYALICRQCQSHNGMALKEEYEYVAFRCCYCFQFNPPRNTQPPPPRLSLPAPPAIAAPPPSEALPPSPDHSSGSSDETELENPSEAEVNLPNASEKTEENSDNTESALHRLSISSDVSEIQANLVEDIPRTPVDPNDTLDHEQSSRESS